MHEALFWLALVSLLIFVLSAIELAVGNRSVRLLASVTPALPQGRGSVCELRVSVVVAACNEERKIESALASVLGQDYENLEFIVIDDRSTDGTGAILDRMAGADSRLRVIHITELPPGWLGKNNALRRGAAASSGELLLFTDADIVMDPSAVRRAVSYLHASQLDHIAVGPHLTMPSVALELFASAFLIFFCLYARPWKAKDPKSSRYIGVGAFNLVRREAYERAGAHDVVRMRPDDDIMLGKVLKKTGSRQEFLNGRGMISVEWYSSMGEVVDGLMKNMFAGLGYSVALVVLATMFQILVNVLPFVALFVTSGSTQALNAAVVLVVLIMGWDSARLHGFRLWSGIAIPLATLLIIYIEWKSMFAAIFGGGVTWRGTKYSLAELKANKV